MFWIFYGVYFVFGQIQNQKNPVAILFLILFYQKRYVVMEFNL